MDVASAAQVKDSVKSHAKMHKLKEHWEADAVQRLTNASFFGQQLGKVFAGTEFWRDRLVAVIVFGHKAGDNVTADHRSKEIAGQCGGITQRI